ncbi:hypothetical protein Scep_021150 [Stephania cephalantha]|uniref:Uncharacterized protein n=1 Tax=Stephania cephalantha TaxID=152367 RepID=A0AAP0F434_9MAGN
MKERKVSKCSNISTTTLCHQLCPLVPHRGNPHRHVCCPGSRLAQDRDRAPVRRTLLAHITLGLLGEAVESDGDQHFEAPCVRSGEATFGACDWEEMGFDVCGGSFICGVRVDAQIDLLLLDRGEAYMGSELILCGSWGLLCTFLEVVVKRSKLVEKWRLYKWFQASVGPTSRVCDPD